MCGILLVLGYVLPEHLFQAARQIRKRGPDMGSITKFQGAYLGFQRLKINGLSSSGNQPFYSDDNKKALMCNGEIYNHKELEKEYDLNCTSGSDCECILKLYEKVGFTKMVSLLDGVYAIVLIDEDHVYLARDSVGIRPLFYGKTSLGDLAVASTARTLSYFCSDIRQVAPGRWIYSRKEKIFINFIPSMFCHLTPSKHRGRNIMRLGSSPGGSFFTVPTALTDRIRDTLVRAVEKRMESDRPIGCMLSGGLDSSLIASILSRSLKKQGKRLRTYSIGMKDSTDLKYALKVATFLDSDHTEIVFTEEEGLEHISEVIADIESYDTTTVRASIAMWLLAKHIRDHTKDRVIFSGEGSDELLCGYLYFHYAPSGKEAAEESERLIHQLYKYDVLRADRCISSHGLEVRVPFLDQDFINQCLGISGDQKRPQHGYEKYILRKAFENGNWLPPSILWRQKEAFSDGVSGGERSWYQILQDYIREVFQMSESQYYRKLFYTHFPAKSYKPDIPLWLPKWIKCGKEPSARILPQYNSGSKLTIVNDL